VTLVAALGCGLAGLSAGSALAGAGVPAQLPPSVTLPGPGVNPGGPVIPAWWPRPWTRLAITEQQGPGWPQLQWVLTCDPAGGTLPQPARACARLSGAWQPFAPPPTDVMCPMIVFGPQSLTITGYWQGTWINAQFNRNDGCQEARWNTIIWALSLPVLQGINPGGPMQSPPIPDAG
jgi:hypothetical protein